MIPMICTVARQYPCIVFVPCWLSGASSSTDTAACLQNAFKGCQSGIRVQYHPTDELEPSCAFGGSIKCRLFGGMRGKVGSMALLCMPLMS
ncbi:uncharacterized protein BKA55DRAFT_167207 [Fusarium redolens]|uniref:Uncharacterized protein n=1 Tax=Fusarium redolens TaxID=48865 RepID=A0A9P9KRG6_FUSRE|nr:uncharacterized protein BKA55DRAFT_167207 [Fusarium redolens]KAH7267180.1 hypothetical protein BKA55DRAFT_167207 [Fusarium redolens]